MVDCMLSGSHGGDEAGTGLRSRRSLIGGAAGAVVALAAAQIVGADPAGATVPTVKLGINNVETTTTTITNTASAGQALVGASTGGGDGRGVEGTVGTGGTALSIGVYGFNNGTGQGVRGDGQAAGVGVYGTNSGAGPGVRGDSQTGDGVEGFNLDGISGIGVRGDGATGVRGNTTSPSGVGVAGVATGGGDGVRGDSDTGYGVLGTTTGGVGVWADHQAGGVALQVTGMSTFSRSGLATVPIGQSSVTVTSVPLTAASLVLATVQQKTGGNFVKSAVPNAAGSSFVINIDRSATVAVKVAWFVVN